MDPACPSRELMSILCIWQERFRTAVRPTHAMSGTPANSSGSGWKPAGGGNQSAPFFYHHMHKSSGEIERTICREETPAAQAVRRRKSRKRLRPSACTCQVGRPEFLAAVTLPTIFRKHASESKLIWVFPHSDLTSAADFTLLRRKPSFDLNSKHPCRSKCSHVVTGRSTGEPLPQNIRCAIANFQAGRRPVIRGEQRRQPHHRLN